MTDLGINRIFVLTPHRLQKWNSSFYAACWLMDSCESVYSVLNGASTCVTYADWACVCVCMSMCVFVFFACRLSSTPTADVPCLFLAHSHSSFASGVETARGCGRTSGRGLEGGLLTMPVTSGNQGKRRSFADLLSVSVFLLFSIKNIDKTLHVYFYLKFV